MSALLHQLFTSPMALVHVVNYIYNTTVPNITYYDQNTNERVIGTEEITGPGQITITLASPRALLISVQ